MTYSKSSKREIGLIQNPARESGELFKIQQERESELLKIQQERELTYSKSSKRETMSYSKSSKRETMSYSKSSTSMKSRRVVMPQEPLVFFAERNVQRMCVYVREA